MEEEFDGFDGFNDDDFNDYQFQLDMMNADAGGDLKLEQGEGKLGHDRKYDFKRKKGKPTNPPPVIKTTQFKKRYTHD